jgi:hypothetical protein
MTDDRIKVFEQPNPRKYSTQLKGGKGDVG